MIGFVHACRGAQVALDVASGLAYLHRRNVIHLVSVLTFISSLIPAASRDKSVASIAS
jgi:hypothetical protein